MPRIVTIDAIFDDAIGRMATAEIIPGQPTTVSSRASRCAPWRTTITTRAEVGRLATAWRAVPGARVFTYSRRVPAE
jgi:hypothetical protein